MITTCPSCGGGAGATRASFTAKNVVECTACGLLFTSPRLPADAAAQAYADDYYSADQAARFRVPAAEGVMRWFRGRRARQLERVLGGVGGKRILDVGCGRGFTLRCLQERGADVFGTQVSQSAAKAAGALIGVDRVFVGEMADVPFAAGSFDVVTMWHVLEHVASPSSVLNEVARLLRPGGVAYVEVPNAGGWTARTFGADWLAYDIEHHVSHFTPESLAAVASGAGLRPIGERHLSLEYSPVTLMQTWLNRLLGGNSRLFRAVTFGESDSRNVSVPIAVHALLGALLFPFAMASSVWLAAQRKGDTYGVWLCNGVNPAMTTRESPFRSAAAGPAGPAAPPQIR